MTGKYFLIESWETMTGSKKYNFFLEVYDEDFKVVNGSVVSDRCLYPTSWAKVYSQMKKATKKAEKAGLKRIYQSDINNTHNPVTK